MNKEKITALKNLLKEFDKIIARKKANVVKKESFKIEIDGEVYESYNEIMDAYGCDIISEAQKETALKKYKLWESGSVKDTLSLELKYLNNIRWNLSQELLEEMKKRIEAYERVPRESNKIDVLDLSVRAYKCLRRNHIDTIGDLCKLTQEGLMVIRNLGRKSAFEVFEKLYKYNGVKLEGNWYRYDD